MNIFLLLVLCAETVLLFWIEKKLWKTGFTPLNFLMIPYMAVLGITLLLSGHLGLDDFYYPSLIPWILGLPLFAIPGWLLFLVERRFSTWRTVAGKPEHKNEELGPKQQKYRFQAGLAIVIVLALSARLIVFLAQGRGSIGNEQFGHLFAGNGWAGHLLLIGISLMMLLLFENRTWPTWIISAFIIFFLFVYQVKSWIILPLLSVLFGLLMTGQIKLGLRRLLGVGIGVTGVFFASYLLIYVSGNRLFPEVTSLGAQLKAISGLFVHYLTSGTLGLSADMQQGILEEPGLQHIFTPFYNLWHVITGQPLVSGINPEYLHTGINLTNVRTFFGSLLVFTAPAGFMVCCLLFGAVCQFFFWWFRHYQSVYTTLLYAWICTVLFMGWFDYLFYLSTIFEIPFWIFAVSCINRFLNAKKKKIWIFSRP